MKYLKFIFIWMCITLMVSCNQNSNNQDIIQGKDNIRQKLTQLMNQIIRDSESLELEKAIEPYVKSEEFLSLSNGYISNSMSLLKQIKNTTLS